MTPLLKTDFSDAQVVQTDDPQWDKLVLPDGEIPIMYEAGTPEDRSARIIDSNLEFMVRNAKIPGDRDGHYKGRVQLNCALPNVESVTMKASMLLLGLEEYRSYLKANNWFTTFELWSGSAISTKPFRVSVNLRKDFGVGKSLYFSVSGSQRDLDGRWRDVWSRSNRLDRPPLDEWFDIELSVRRNRLKFNLPGGPILDVTNVIPTPFTMIQPCKLYASGAVIDHMREAGQPARILWDSLEIST